MNKIEKRSTHPVDIKNWIIKVMNSCETTQQLVKADRLRDNFSRILDKKRTKMKKKNIFGELDEKYLKQIDYDCDTIREIDYYFLAKLDKLDNK